MFENTKKNLKQIGRVFKIIGLILKIIGQLFPINYLIFLIILGIGSLTANILFLSLSFLYLAFFLFMELREFNKKTNKALRKWVKNVYRWSKRLIRLLFIIIPSYGLILTLQNFSPLALVLLIFTVFGIILEIIWNIFMALLKRFVRKKKDKLVKSFRKDVSNIFPRETADNADQNDFSDFGDISELDSVPTQENNTAAKKVSDFNDI